MSLTEDTTEESWENEGGAVRTNESSLSHEVGSLKEFVEFLVKHLVNHPEDVRVNEVEASIRGSLRILAKACPCSLSTGR